MVLRTFLSTSQLQRTYPVVPDGFQYVVSTSVKTGDDAVQGRSLRLTETMPVVSGSKATSEPHNEGYQHDLAGRATAARVQATRAAACHVSSELRKPHGFLSRPAFAHARAAKPESDRRPAVPASSRASDANVAAVCTALHHSALAADKLLESRERTGEPSERLLGLPD